jgi:sterol desaturase/sphingolipid hydroxylase (fatty acid hydroxylase superfamily)
MNIFISFGVIVTTFSFSTITAFVICYVNNYPFINPTLTNEEKINKINEYIRNVPLLLFQSTSLMYIVSDNIIPYGKHNWVESLYSICLYFLLIEAIYYIYHRIIHKYYYKNVHKKHHINIIVYPIDTFFLTELDDLASIISIGMPIIFINVSVCEQIIILYIYITTAYLSHSELYWSHHSIHHRLLNCNYCILFPIFDILFGTYKSVNKDSNKLPNYLTNECR